MTSGEGRVVLPVHWKAATQSRGKRSDHPSSDLARPLFRFSSVLPLEPLRSRSIAFSLVRPSTALDSEHCAARIAGRPGSSLWLRMHSVSVSPDVVCLVAQRALVHPDLPPVPRPGLDSTPADCHPPRPGVITPPRTVHCPVREILRAQLKQEQQQQQQQQ